jgi:protein-S-isoprenylcysteine O-methyltransferase Ste14
VFKGEQEENMKIVLQLLASSLVGLVFFGVLLFLPAGTLNYWQAWLFIAVFTVFTTIPCIYLAMTNPAVLRRRMRAGPAAETRTAQRIAISCMILSLVAMFVVSAVDHRFGWSHVPTAVVLAGGVLVALGLGISMLVVMQNSYAASTVRVEAEQTVVSTGLYSLVRHPMYVGALIMMVGTPLALDSYWGLVTIVPALLALAYRISDEEIMLRQELAGYDEYTQKVHYRLVPGMW